MGGRMHNGHVKLGDLGCAKNIPDAVAKTSNRNFVLYLEKVC